MLENLYGKEQIKPESMVVGLALRNAAIRETAHPNDRELWTPEVPSYGHCDLFTDFCRRIWGKKTDAQILVWWAYSNHQAFLDGSRKNKLTVHYSYHHSNYGEIDLSRDQFPDNTYLHPRPRPLSHMVPADRSWDISSDIPHRRNLVEPAFASNLLHSPLPPRLTPQLDHFLEQLYHSGHR